MQLSQITFFFEFFVVFVDDNISEGEKQAGKYEKQKEVLEVVKELVELKDEFEYKDQRDIPPKLEKVNMILCLDLVIHYLQQIN